MARGDDNAWINTIGQGTRLKGEVMFEEDVLIDGEVEGAILVHGRLVLGEHARIQADIQASEVEVRGQVDGQIKCEHRLTLTATAQIRGDVSAELLVVNEGAQLEGKVSMNVATDPLAEDEIEPLDEPLDPA